MRSIHFDHATDHINPRHRFDDSRGLPEVARLYVEKPQILWVAQFASQSDFNPDGRMLIQFVDVNWRGEKLHLGSFFLILLAKIWEKEEEGAVNHLTHTNGRGNVNWEFDVAKMGTWKR